MTLGELLTKLGYDHVLPQPSLVNAEIVVEDPIMGDREPFSIDLRANTDNKIILHFK